MRIPIRSKTYNEQYGSVENVTCSNCGKITQFVKVRNKSMTSVMFIPIINVTNVSYVQCTSCSAAYEVDKNDFSQMNNNIDILNSIYNYQMDKLGKK